MELVPGPSLADRLDKGPFPVPEAIRLGAQIAAALEEAHEHGVVHRDLKPANVRLTGRGDAKVLDFGIARLIESRGSGPDGLPTETATVAGTVPYMSPEQLRGELVDARADIWALGVLTCELLTGRRPFDRPTCSCSSLSCAATTTGTGRRRRGPFTHAIDLKPSFASAHHATRLDPLSLNFIASEGRILYRMHRYTEAVERYQRALQIDPAFQPALSRIVEAYREQRRFGDASAAIRELERHGADARRVRVQHALLAAAEGRRAEALRNADGPAEDVLAYVWCYLGDRDKAFAHLNTAVRTRAVFPFQLRDPALDPIRGDHRFKALLREVGIPG